MTALRLPSTLTNAQATTCLQQLQAGLAQLPAGSTDHEVYALIAEHA